MKAILIPAIAIAAIAAISSVPAADGDLPFLRGDADGSGAITVTDPVLVLRYAFQGGMSPIGCLDAADANDDGAIGITDAVGILRYLFDGGSPPAGPFPIVGIDGTPDALDCQLLRGSRVPVWTVFVIDRSSTMRGDRWSKVQEIAAEELARLDRDDWFGIFLFDGGYESFPSEGVAMPASGEARAMAADFIASTVFGTSSCPKPALVAALEMLQDHPAVAGTKRIVFCSAGFVFCQGMDDLFYGHWTLAELTARNVDGVIIDTVFVDYDGGFGDWMWMREVASRSGGTFTHVVP